MASHYCRAVADRLRGRAAATAGSARGPELLADAVATFDRLGMPFDAAVCRLDWAEAAAATTRPPPRPSSGVWRSSTASALDRPLTGPGGCCDGSAAARLHGPVLRAVLSGREAEVARLVAEGLSNVAVAERLFISPRTVTTHLERIYRRLDIGSRAELTRYVRDRQLVT